MSHQKILILDFGSQYTQLIARRVREQQVYCELHPNDVSEAFIREFNPQGIILSGGPNSVYEEETPRAPQVVFDLGVPVLGICYGMQTMAAQLGGKVENAHKREFGYAEVRARGHSKLLDGIQDSVNAEGHGLLDVWMTHGDKVTELPAGFKVIAANDATPIAGMADDARRFYGVQFHPEVTHTIKGRDLFVRFVRDICACRGDWNMPDYVDEAIAKVKQQVGQDEVILGLSGGVDSSVVAALLHRAIGDKLTCVFVDNGLLRLNEAEQVMQTFARNLGVKVIHVDACGAVHGASGRRHRPRAEAPHHRPRVRRGVPGRSAEAAQGALAGAGHHLSRRDRVGRRQDQEGPHHQEPPQRRRPAGDAATSSCCEPLRELFKDEVRELGIALGLPHEMVYRHPFPGPGLGVRILGEVKQEYADLLRRADAIFIDELRAADWYEKTSQAFAVFLPVKSVGVMGDGRTYDYVVALRAVETQDFMTARWAQLPYELLGRVANRIVNEVRGINRVTYDITGKPPGTIEWE